MKQRWIAVIGSPRKGRNTDLLVSYVTEALNAKDIQVEKFYLPSKNISTCTGCESCINTGSCGIKDDISAIIENMKTADGYIFASPTYNYNVTSQMKALLDRTFCLNDYTIVWKSRLSPNKKAIIVAACAGDSSDSMGYTIEGMVRPLSELGVEIIHVIEYYNTKNKPVAENNRMKEEICQRISGIL